MYSSGDDKRRFGQVIRTPVTPEFFLFALNAEGAAGRKARDPAEDGLLNWDIRKREIARQVILIDFVPSERQRMQALGHGGESKAVGGVGIE